MEKFVTSQDGTPIYYECTPAKQRSLVFVHGWLGNGRWWDAQRDALAQDYTIVQLDLAGHGRSGKERQNWSVAAYAEDIKAVVDDAGLEAPVLVGHSMSGSNVLEAGLLLNSRVSGIILVDTLHNLSHMPTPDEISPLMAGLRQNYEPTIEAALTNFLLRPYSPAGVRQRLRQEFLAVTPELAIATLEPFYRTDMRPTAAQLKVPVRAINGDSLPTNLVENQRFLRDFDFLTLADIGHYPMLEDAERFNHVLKKMLGAIFKNQG